MDEPLRYPECVRVWPGAESGYYDPRCCRWPKSCSANVPDMDPPDAAHAAPDEREA